MQGWADFKEQIRRHFTFSYEETRLLILYIIVLGFIVGFNDGRETFNLIPWLRNLVNCIIIIALALIVHESAKKIAGLHFGQRTELKIWGPGLAIGVVLALFTNGEWIFIVSGGMVAHMMTATRIGRFRYGFSYNDLGIIAAAGPLANLGLAILLRLLAGLPLPAEALISKAITVNLLFAIYNMLPIPPLPGAMVLFASRSWYVFTFVCILSITALMLLISSLFWTIVGSLIIGFVVFIIYFAMIEAPIK